MIASLATTLCYGEHDIFVISAGEHVKIGIVGTGAVGSTAAYSLVLQGVGSELVLVDHNRALAEAHVADILHATPFAHPVHVRCGDFSDLAGCALVILAAGVAQAAGETRTQLLKRNAEIFATMVPQVVRYAGDAVILVASNPLDVMTQIVTKLAGLPPGRVLGTGTILDTARFRTLIGERYKVSPASVHAHVVGEHGDSEVLVWSGAQVAGIALPEFAERCQQPLSAAVMQEIDAGVRRAAYHIIAGKGATYYGIGAALARLSRCILYDERVVFTACSVVAEVQGITDVAVSLPMVIGRAGVLSVLDPTLSAAESQALRDSARIIEANAASVGY